MQSLYTIVKLHVDSAFQIFYTCYANFFKGKELVVSGQLGSDKTGKNLQAVVTGQSKDGKVILSINEIVTESHTEADDLHLPPLNYMERLWAFLTLQVSSRSNFLM